VTNARGACSCRHKVCEIKWPGSERQSPAIRVEHLSKRREFQRLRQEAAISGQGVALGSKALVLEHLAAGRLIRPFKLSLVTDFAYYVVCAKSRADEPDLCAIRSWLLAESQRTSRGA
jgi:DNA-binding transcriptional LysR family regulator